MWRALMRSWVFEMPKYLKRVRSSFFHFFIGGLFRRDPSQRQMLAFLWSGRRMLNSLCCRSGRGALWSWKCRCSCSGCALRNRNCRCSSDFLRARNCRCFVLVVRLDPVAKYNVHANRLDQCLSNTTFNHQQPWWSEQKQQQHALWKTS